MYFNIITCFSSARDSVTLSINRDSIKKPCGLEGYAIFAYQATAIDALWRAHKFSDINKWLFSYAWSSETLLIIVSWDVVLWRTFTSYWNFKNITRSRYQKKYELTNLISLVYVDITVFFKTLWFCYDLDNATLFAHIACKYHPLHYESIQNCLLQLATCQIKG